MKRYLVSTILACAAAVGTAQVIEVPRLADNWSVGVDGGVTTPLNNGAFFGNMRGTVGLNVQKRISMTFALGAEGAWAVNTSSWPGMFRSATAFDASYVGAFGAVDLLNLFSPAPSCCRPVTVELAAGAGWGHLYQSGRVEDHNFFATKVGLNLRVRATRRLSVNIKPSVMWDMSDARASQTSAAYDSRLATFNIMAGLSYRLGACFRQVRPYDQAQVDDLNSQINDLRTRLDDVQARAERAESDRDQLSAELQACRDNKPAIVREVRVDNRLNTECDVFFNIGSSTINASQMPNVERIASYMKNHPGSTVVIKGYASKDGNLDFNLKLAQRRADAVRKALIDKYRINPARITAKGQGIGDMFEEESWNRVSICTLENAK